MKVLIVSDTHGKNNNVLKVWEKVAPIDLFIHLGDYDGGEDYIRSIIPCPAQMVSGNNDFFNGLPKDKIIFIGKYRILLTHGHRYGVNHSTYDLREAARNQKADIVMFGHTHVPMVEYLDDMWVINPGSLALPRQNGRVPTFIIMDIDSKGEVHFTLNHFMEM